MRTKIVSLAPYTFLPAKVGGQKHIALFYQYLSAHIPVHCVTTQSNDPSCAQGYKVENPLSPSALRYINPFYFFLLRKILKREAATHLLIEHPYYGWLAVLLKWFCNVKLIVHSHNIESLRFKTTGKWWWRLLWYYERFVHRQADHSFFITDEDREYGLQAYGLAADKCHTFTYGIAQTSVPAAEERSSARTALLQEYQLPTDTILLFYNGTFDYLPNREGLFFITSQLVPLLQQQAAFSFAVLICGRDIPESLTAQPMPGVHFAGFVDDISRYFKGTDLFINPVTSGGGIKTKLVEALGYNLNAVSTVTGATGVNPALCNGKLVVVQDHDITAFAHAVTAISSYEATTPIAYFDHFSWEKIAARAAAVINRQ